MMTKVIRQDCHLKNINKFLYGINNDIINDFIWYFTL